MVLNPFRASGNFDQDERLPKDGQGSASKDGFFGLELRVCHRQWFAVDQVDLIIG